MDEILIAFALAQCSHYSVALAMGNRNVEIYRMACRVSSIDAYGSPLQLKDCAGYYPDHEMICEFEVTE